MERLFTCVLNAGNLPQSIAGEIKKKFSGQGIECTDTPEKNNKTALIVWTETMPLEEVFEYLHECYSQDFKVIILNRSNHVPDLVKWQLLRAGAKDFLDWKAEEQVIELVRCRIKRWQQVEEIMASEAVKSQVIGESMAWKRFLRNLIETAHFTGSNVLLTGESGTGKELVAALLHNLDQRQEKGELTVLDCTTIVPELSGSEFYGHEKGAFTNAIYSRDGAFALANNGTLFLDELGELPLVLQAGLLRVIQEKIYKRVGSNTWQKTNFRLVCATNRNLKKEMAEGRFREDLYYRVASAVFTLPSLHERREDIPELVRHFLRQELKTIVAPEIDGTLMSYLVSRNYPGNIRELKQLVTRMAMRYTGENCITPGNLPEEEFPEPDQLKAVWNQQNQGLQQSIRLAIAGGKDLPAIKNEIANLALEIALEDCGGNLKLAARKLNVEVRTLQYIRKRNA